MSIAAVVAGWLGGFMTILIGGHYSGTQGLVTGGVISVRSAPGLSCEILVLNAAVHIDRAKPGLHYKDGIGTHGWADQSLAHLDAGADWVSEP